MPDDADRRDQIARLRQMAVESLRAYTGGFAALERIDRDLKSIIWALDEIANPAWTDVLISLWGPLEITYACALQHDSPVLTEEDESYVREAVGKLLAELKRYEIPLRPDETPREHDNVRTRTPLKAHGLPAGAVVVDYAASTDGGLVDEYEVQFAGRGGGEGLLINVSGEQIEIVCRPGYGPIDRTQ